jgi:hypothetical protein
MMQMTHELCDAPASEATPTSNVIRLADYAHRMCKSRAYYDEPATIIVLPVLQLPRALAARG